MLIRNFRFYSSTAEGGNAQGQAPANSGQEPQNPPTASGPSAGQEPAAGKTVEQLTQELSDARKEAAKYRTERNGFETDLKKRQEAEMTEAEKLKASADEANGKLTAMQQRVVKSEVKVAATKVNIVDPDMAYMAIADKIEVKDGEAVNIEALLAALVKEKPYLVAAAGASNGSPSNPGRGSRQEQTAQNKIDSDYDKRRGNVPVGRI